MCLYFNNRLWKYNQSSERNPCNIPIYSQIGLHVRTLYNMLEYLTLFYLSRCWLPSENGLIWAFLGPAIAIIVVSTLHMCMYYVNRYSKYKDDKYIYI